MAEKKKKIFPLECPICHATHWVDPVTQKILRTERAKRKKGNLDDMLTKEKERKSEFERKFEATAALQKEKYEQAKEKFKKAFDTIDDED
ncbi:hypothetical protein ACFLT9_13380 [Acidobacteriota bacterium]